MSLTFTLQMDQNIEVNPDWATSNQEANCLFFPSSPGWRARLNCNLHFLQGRRGCESLCQNPFCPSSLWGRTAKVLRGEDLEDLFFRRHAFLSPSFFPFHFRAFAFLLLWHCCRAEAPADQPVSLGAAWQLQSSGPNKNQSLAAAVGDI